MSASGPSQCLQRFQVPANPRLTRGRFDRAAAEFVAAQRLNADRPQARVTLANFLMQRGQATEAEAEYKAARRLNPQFAPAAINLADLYRSLGREDDGVAVLRDAAATMPQDASLRYAAGLALVRRKKQDEALAELKRAVVWFHQAHDSYVYTVCSHSAGGLTMRLRQSQQQSDETSNGSRVAARSGQLLIVTAATSLRLLEYAQRLAQIAPNDRSNC